MARHNGTVDDEVTKILGDTFDATVLGKTSNREREAITDRIVEAMQDERDHARLRDAGTSNLTVTGREALLRRGALRTMPDDPAELRRKAEACRELAVISDTSGRKAHWIGQAQHYEALAIKAEAPRPTKMKKSKPTKSQPRNRK